MTSRWPASMFAKSRTLSEIDPQELREHLERDQERSGTPPAVDAGVGTQLLKYGPAPLVLDARRVRDRRT